MFDPLFMYTLQLLSIHPNAFKWIGRRGNQPNIGTLLKLEEWYFLTFLQECDDDILFSLSFCFQLPFFCANISIKILSCNLFLVSPIPFVFAFLDLLKCFRPYDNNKNNSIHNP